MGSDKAHDLPSIEGLRHVLIPARDGDQWDHGELPQAVLNLDNQTVLARCEVLLRLAVVANRSLDGTSAARAVALREVILGLLPKDFDHPFCSVLRALAGLEQGTAGRRREQRQEVAGRALGPDRYPIHPRSVRRRVREDCWPWLLDRLIEQEVRLRRDSDAVLPATLDRRARLLVTDPVARWVASRFEVVVEAFQGRGLSGMDRGGDDVRDLIGFTTAALGGRDEDTPHLRSEVAANPRLQRPLRRDESFRQAEQLLQPPVASGVPSVGLDELERIAAALDDARRCLDAEVVEFLRGRLADCAASDAVRGPKETLPTALGIVGAVANAVREVRPSVRTDLLAVGAQGAELVGWLYRDLGVPATADYWRDRAIEWAREAGDQSMQTYVQLKKSQAPGTIGTRR